MTILNFKFLGHLEVFFFLICAFRLICWPYVSCRAKIFSVTAAGGGVGSDETCDITHGRCFAELGWPTAVCLDTVVESACTTDDSIFNGIEIIDVGINGHTNAIGDV